MTSDKVDNIIINHFYGKIKRIKYGFLDTNDLFNKMALYSLVSISLKNEEFFEEKDIQSLIDVIRA